MKRSYDRFDCAQKSMNKIPLILDTDIGSDIDDTWALAMLLRSLELDVKLIVTGTGNTTYRAALVAKLLQIAGRTDIPIGIGLHQSDETGPQAAWLNGFSLADYPGKVYENGVSALIEAVMASPEPVTLLCLGPVPNIAAALEWEPRLAERAKIVGMFGSVRKGYDGRAEISREYNVYADADACRKMFAAFPSVTITPLDTCGLVKLTDERYAQVRDSADPLMRAVIENYRIWARHVTWTRVDAETGSSTLFDTVAVYLAFAEDLLEMEEVGLRVTEEGYTVIDETVKPIRCAMAWKNSEAFELLLVRKLLGKA